MTVNDSMPAHGPTRTPRGRWAPLAAGVTAAALTVAAIATAAGGTAGAATTPLSQASGRFLSGTVGGQSLDVVAGIEGEAARNPGNPGPNQNSLNVELLNNALNLPFGSSGLQLPDPTSGAVQLGAVAQYARANSDGSALGAAGAVDSNGGIGVGGSNGVPTGGATLDLSNSPLLKPVASAIADVKLRIGAVTARAHQAAIGQTLPDPSASCTNGPFSRVSDKDQAGKYDIASLSLDANSALLAALGTQLKTTLDGLAPTLDSITTLLGGILGKALNGLVTVNGLPLDIPSLIDSLLKIDIGNGAITLNLSSGALHVDLEALLAFLHLDIDKLCPNTSLLPYLVKAITTGLPGALSALVSSLTDTLTTALHGLSITVANTTLSAQNIADLTDQLLAPLTAALGSALSSANLSQLLTPILDLVTNDLLDIVVNAQDESGGTFTETAVQVVLLPGGSSISLPTLPAFKTGMVKGKATQDRLMRTARKAVADRTPEDPAKADAGATRELAKQGVRIHSLATAPANALVVLNLAQASVGPNSAAPTPTPTATSTARIPPTSVPTGVPAGAGTHSGTPVLPIVLLALGLMFAAGGVTAYRMRGMLNRH